VTTFGDKDVRTASADDAWEGRFPAEPEAVADARRATREFCARHGASKATVTDIELGVSEAVSNAVVHAFVGRAPGTVLLQLRAHAGAVAVNVVDDGNGMAPRSDSPGLGLGLPTIAQLTEHFDVRTGPDGRGTDLAMRFPAPGVTGPQERWTGEQAAVLVEVARIADTDGWPDVGAERFTELLVHELVDAAIVDVAAEDGEHVQRLAVRVAGDEDRRHARYLMARGMGASAETSPTRAAMRTGELQVFDLEDLPDERDLAEARAMRLRWWISVPLRHGERLHGALGLGLTGARPAPDETFTALCEQVAERAAGALAHHRVIGELQRSRLRLERILGVLGEAVTVHDQKGRMAYANQAAARLLGSDSVEEVLTLPPTELAGRFSISREDGSPVTLEDLPGYRVLSGESASTLVTRSVHLTTGREYWLQTTATRLDDEGPLAVNVIRDVTDSKLSELRQRFLARAGELLLAQADTASMLPSIARLVVGPFADWCAVDLLRGDRLERVALAHADPERPHALLRRAPDLTGTEGVAAVVRDGRPRLYEDLGDEVLEAGAGGGPDRLAALRALGIRSAIIVPLTVGERPLGALTLVNADSRRVFGPDDLAFATDLARRTALAIAHARLRD
jgi:PAS domain S-box-containing protein